MEGLFKNKVLEGFQMRGDITWSTVLITVALAFVLGLFVYFIYKRTFAGVLFTKSFGLSLVLLSMVTSAVIMTISSDLYLGLGMVGALSIVRFRTAVKDPMDTMFMFWEIGEGIMIGAGLYLVAVIAAVLIGVLMIVLSLFHFKRTKPYVLVLRFEASAKQEVQRLLSRFPEGKLKSKTVSKGVIELTIEMNAGSQEIGLMEKFVEIPGVYDASLISYSGDVVG
ncbi:MAG: DUF4956 domain-containing protein [Christensenellaceae bacterium]|nr:DUF4956 domain-containing protein [Christensenellaceae bacterium]